MEIKLKQCKTIDVQLCNDLKNIWLELIDANGDAIGEIRKVAYDYQLLVYKNKDHIGLPISELNRIIEIAKRNLDGE